MNLSNIKFSNNIIVLIYHLAVHCQALFNYFYTMEKPQSFKLEFVTLMASLMSIVALSIDALLPALQEIGLSVGFQKETDGQLLVTMIFLGLGIGQLFFGPLSDTFGRKKIIYTGLLFFILSSFICIFAKSLEVMILGRILQGISLECNKANHYNGNANSTANRFPL